MKEVYFHFTPFYIAAFFFFNTAFLKFKSTMPQNLKLPSHLDLTKEEPEKA